MSPNSFVLLTGARENAGDHLIRKRAIALLNSSRPDRHIIEWDRSVRLEGEALEVVNASAALLLTGGPGIRRDMYPSTFRLAEGLEDIRVPIMTYGCGWKSLSGSEKESRAYRFSEASRQLLFRISQSGYLSSVRDSQTLDLLSHSGYGSFKMTGCPAYYPEAGSPVMARYTTGPRWETGSIVFSAGVGYVHSPGMAEQSCRLLEAMRDRWSRARIVVAFHHGVDAASAERNFGSRAGLHLKFVEWCKGQGFDLLDLSGDVGAMEEAYAACDLHIGFRVHAHILRLSGGGPSVLLAEDGRGIALGETLGGLVVRAFSRCNDGILSKATRAASRGRWPELYVPDRTAPGVVMNLVENEERAGWPSMAEAIARMGKARLAMDDFLRSLP